MQAKLNSAPIIRLLTISTGLLLAAAAMTFFAGGQPPHIWLLMLALSALPIGALVFRRRDCHITVSDQCLVIVGPFRRRRVNFHDSARFDSVRGRDGDVQAFILASDSGKVFVDANMLRNKLDFTQLLNAVVDAVPDAQQISSARKRKIPSVSIFLCAAMSAIYLALSVIFGADLETALYAGAANKILIFSGEAYRIATAAFLHSSLSHLVLNGICLLVVGEIMESVLRKVDFLATFLVSAIISIGISSIAIEYDALLGASGGIFGLMGAFTWFLWRRPHDVPTVFAGPVKILVVITLIEIISSLYIESVATGCHIAGFITGFLYTALLSHATSGRWPVISRSLSPAVVALTGILTATSLLHFYQQLKDLHSPAASSIAQH